MGDDHGTVTGAVWGTRIMQAERPTLEWMDGDAVVKVVDDAHLKEGFSPPKPWWPALAALIRACWAPVPCERPPFTEVVARLEELEAASREGRGVDGYAPAARGAGDESGGEGGAAVDDLDALFERLRADSGLRRRVIDFCER